MESKKLRNRIESILNDLSKKDERFIRGGSSNVKQDNKLVKKIDSRLMNIADDNVRFIRGGCEGCQCRCGGKMNIDDIRKENNVLGKKLVGDLLQSYTQPGPDMKKGGKSLKKTRKVNPWNKLVSEVKKQNPDMNMADVFRTASMIRSQVM